MPSPAALPFTAIPVLSSSESVSSSKSSLNSFLSSSFLSSCFLRLISGKFKSSSWEKNKENTKPTLSTTLICTFYTQNAELKRRNLALPCLLGLPAASQGHREGYL